MAGCGTKPDTHDHGNGHEHGHDHGASTETGSGRTVKCVKYQKDMPGLDEPPMPGAMGQRLFENVSRDAWKMWTEHQKMLLNEYRLSLLDPKSRTFLREQLEQFFFGEGSALPPDFVAPRTK